MSLPFFNPQIMADNDIKLGKKAGIITYRVGDKILAREYNPKVANPRTEKQVLQRAKIKLLSQLAAIVRDIIAIFPTSEKSARALFLADNWQFVDGQELTAEYVLQFLRLTHSDIPLVPIAYHCNNSELGYIRWIKMDEEPQNYVNVVFYYLFTRNDQGKIYLLDMSSTDTRGLRPDRQYYRWNCDAISVDDNGKTLADYYVFGFAMSFLTEDAETAWEDNPYFPPEFLAPQIKEHLVTPDLFQFTETKYLFIPRGT